MILLTFHSYSSFLVLIDPFWRIILFANLVNKVARYLYSGCRGVLNLICDFSYKTNALSGKTLWKVQLNGFPGSPPSFRWDQKKHERWKKKLWKIQGKSNFRVLPFFPSRYPPFVISIAVHKLNCFGFHKPFQYHNMDVFPGKVLYRFNKSMPDTTSQVRF